MADSRAAAKRGTKRAALAFARHETFHPRFGWIKKGFDAAQKDPSVFLREDAPVILGVGKNMVRAIRYWCTAFKVLSGTGRLLTDADGPRATDFGRMLVSDEGLDPYLEDPGSLWLLHWKLLLRPCAASAWHFTFGLFSQLEFSVDDLVDALKAWVEREAPNSRVVTASLRKDANCLIRMYGEVGQGRILNEDSIHCPFVELGLLRPMPGQRRTYSFGLGAKPGLSSELVAATCLEFASLESRTARSISLSRLLRAPMSPGMSFKLTESALYQALEEAVETDDRIQLADTAGLLQLSFADDPGKLCQTFIKRHYKAHSYRRVSA